MYLERRIPLRIMFRWTLNASILFIINATIPVILYTGLGWKTFSLPWSLVALVGTAVAFLISFQNNAAYDRVWEARKVWGGIVNSTRTLSVYVRDMIEKDNSDAVKVLLYRHRAWLTALRFAMRTQKSWEIPEAVEEKRKERFNRLRYNPERVESFEESMRPLLSNEDYEYVMSAPNAASAILGLQSKHLQELRSEEKLWGFSFLELEGLIRELYTLQGKSERIKNFPYPRQYFTLGVHLTWAFIILLPYAMIPEFAQMGKMIAKTTSINAEWFTVFSIPFVACVSWVFHTMGRMGRAGENPFEGTIHDVPISAMARNLEIEISHFLGEPEAKRPQPFPVLNSIQM